MGLEQEMAMAEFDCLLEGLTELTRAEAQNVARYVAAVQGGPAVGAFNERVARRALGHMSPTLRRAVVGYIGQLVQASWAAEKNLTGTLT
jgi:hypothetical protein